MVNKDSLLREIGVLSDGLDRLVLSMSARTDDFHAANALDPRTVPAVSADRFEQRAKEFEKFLKEVVVRVEGIRTCYQKVMGKDILK